MNIRLQLLLLLLTACAGQAACKQQVSATAPQATPSDAAGPDVSSIVDRIMRAAFGPPDANACHRHVDGSTGLEYCMRVDPEDIHVVGGGLLFFMAHSDPTKGNYAAVDPGVMAAYEVLLRNGREEVIAKTNALVIGAAGSCQCEHAQFLEMGPDSLFGWLFTYGGTWQGIDAYSYAIVAPVGPEFRNVSEIPQVEEGQQQVSYSVSVMRSLQSTGFYPLDVRKTSDGKTIERVEIEYDPARRSYHF